MNGLIKNVTAIVEDVFECPGKLERKIRKRPIPDARVAYSKLLSVYAPYLSNSSIGKSINRDHAAVWHYLNKHEDLFTINDTAYILRYNACEARVKGLSNVKPVDYREELQERLQMLSQEKCAGLLTLLKNYI